MDRSPALPAASGDGDARTIDVAPAADRDLFQEIYLGYGRRIFAFAIRLTGGNHAAAEDLMAETMMRVHGAIQSTRVSNEAVFSWLCTICTNIFRDQKRKERTRVKHDDHVRGLYYPTSAPGREAHTGQDQEQEAIWREVRAHIESLPAEERDCIQLKLAGYSYEEIGTLVRLDFTAVKNRIQNAMRDLRGRFAGRVCARDEEDESCEVRGMVGNTPHGGCRSMPAG